MTSSFPIVPAVVVAEDPVADCSPWPVVGGLQDHEQMLPLLRASLPRRWSNSAGGWTLKALTIPCSNDNAQRLGAAISSGHPWSRGRRRDP